jgi:DNA-binding MarR family transcriptional regulator
VPADPHSPTETARAIVGLLRALRRDLLRSSRSGFARSGLTAAQLGVISSLAARGPLTLTELGRELALGHSTLSGIVDRLAAKGIVQRTPSPDDRRYTRISLTEDARRHGGLLGADDPSGRLVALLADATPGERQTIVDGLTLLRRFVEAASGEPRAAGPPADRP